MPKPTRRKDNHEYLEKFSRWYLWEKLEDNLEKKLASPGIYALAISKQPLPEPPLAGKPFTFRKEIVYFGMTNAKGGLRGRLNQFDSTFSEYSKKAHGGAERFRGKYKDSEIESLKKRLYVSVMSFPCNVKSPKSEDLRMMGEVAKAEYECLAHYMDQNKGQLPEFNDKKRSPKRPRSGQSAAG